ncbi:uncharacterized protein [Oscarella lobularis]|uniref:uncharacterized protein n=1 Tax=Oscarella lobularis TaxID=121494 RepID=UPI00331323AF
MCCTPVSENPYLFSLGVVLARMSLLCRFVYPILLSTCFPYVSSQDTTNQSTSVVVQYRFQSPTAMPYSHANSHTSSTPGLTHSSSIQDVISSATLSAVNHTTATPTSITPTPVKKKNATNDNEKFFPIDFRNSLNNSTSMTSDSDGRGFFLTSNGGIALIIFLVFALTFSIVTCILLFTWRRDNPRCSRDGLKAARSSFSTLPVQHVYTNKGADGTATASVEVVQEPVTMTTSDRKRKLGQYDGRMTEEEMKISQGRMKRVSFFDPTNDDVWESEI